MNQALIFRCRFLQDPQPFRQPNEIRLHHNRQFGRLQSMIAIKETDVATNLVVRNVDEDVALALKQMAVAHGRSAEAEHREILRSALQRPKRRSVAAIALIHNLTVVTRNVADFRGTGVGMSNPFA